MRASTTVLAIKRMSKRHGDLDLYCVRDGTLIAIAEIQFFRDPVSKEPPILIVLTRDQLAGADVIPIRPNASG